MTRTRLVVVGLTWLALAAPERARADLGGLEAPHSPEQARAQKALQAEFDEVARPQVAEIRAHARRILSLLRKGDIEPLVDECVMYGGNAKDRRELTRKYLLEHRDELQRMALLAELDTPDFAEALRFSSPAPERGMVGQVAIPFGPTPPRPKDRRLAPDHHQLELWWSGQVMPEANGAVRVPPAGTKRSGRWRFYKLVAPYSQRRGQLL